MRWMIVASLVAAVIAVLRIYTIVRRSRGASRHDWDERQVRDFRNGGGNPFTLYDVDFLFSVPDQNAAAGIASALSKDGFTVDHRPRAGQPDQPVRGYSVHASQSMRVTVSTMQEYSTRFSQMAKSAGGSYDGWVTNPTRVSVAAPKPAA